MRVLLAALFLASPATAEEILGDVSGNWAAPANDGFHYRAMLTSDGEYLRLRIWQGPIAGEFGPEPQLDNPRIAYASGAANGRNWLEVSPNGALQVNSVLQLDGYLYSERLTLRMMDFQFTTMAYAFYNNPVAADAVPDQPFQCHGESCYSCEADLWNASAMAAGERVAVPRPDFEALNASLWTPESIYQLGFCPAPN